MLSDSVAKGLRLLYGDDCSETIHFIEMFDKLFDCMNVTNFKNSFKSLKPFKMPFVQNDHRFKVHINYYYNLMHVTILVAE